MKRILIASLSLSVMCSCSIFKPSIKIDGVMDYKQKIDASQNPALKYTLRNELSKKRIKLYDITVKDITESGNIDYDFCVVADVQTKAGPVECHIYSSKVKKIARLEKGRSRIDVSGDYGRFFSVMESTAMRLEIIKASITIK